MTDDAKLRVESSRGKRASRLLENDLLKEAFKKIEDEISESWKQSGGPDREQRENAYYMHRAVQSLKLNLNTLVTTGKFADRILVTKELKTKKEGA